jgi:Holliday junction resolvase RusA-like endonuclease
MRFTVHGIPQPGGSKNAFVIKSTNRAVVTDANPKAKEWKSLVAYEAALAMRGTKLFEGPVSLSIEFYLPRPKSHFIGGERCKGLRKGSPMLPTTKPDSTKLLRSTEDAMTGIVWHDDAQVCDEHVIKRYTEEGAMAVIEVDEIIALNGIASKALSNKRANT